MNMRALISAIAFALTGAGSCASVQSNSNAIAIEHVTVLSMAPNAAPAQDCTIIIENGRISAIGPSRRVHPPRGAQIIDGRGKFLMPGLADMHTHPENITMVREFTGNPDLPDGAYPTEDVFLPWLANGVTQVLNMSANSDSIAQRDAIESGAALGPHMALAPMVDGTPRLWAFATEAATPEAGVAFVRQAHEAGYDFIKVYSQLDPSTFTAIVSEARALNMRVIGHLPGREQDQPERFLQPDFVMVAHAEEFAYQPAHIAEAQARIPAFTQLARESGIWLTATLTVNERIVEQARDFSTVAARPELRFLNPITRAVWLHGNPYKDETGRLAPYVEQVVAFNRALVRSFYEAGVPILPGTDSPLPGLAPGFSLHDELEAMARAGMSNIAVLEAATRRSAEFLGVQGDRGTVAAGKRADLLLLDANPLADVANTRRIAAVFINGRYLSAEELHARMEALALRNAD
ncbi:MAG: amidohydrolase family protein [Terricaulis sp.]